MRTSIAIRQDAKVALLQVLVISDCDLDIVGAALGVVSVDWGPVECGQGRLSCNSPDKKQN